MMRAIAVLLVLSGHAFAVSCPPSSGGRRLTAVEGGAVYIGDPARHMMVTPERTARMTNVWLTPDAARLRLMCRYESGRVLVLPLPAETRQCVEDLAERSVACR